MTGRGRTPGPLRAVGSLSSCAGVEREVTSRSVLCSVLHMSAPRCLLTARLPPGGRHAHSLSRFEGATLITPCPLGLPSLGESAFPGVGEWGGAGPCLPHVRVFGTPRDRWRRALPRARPQRQPSSQRHVFIIAKAESVYLEFSQERASPPTVLESLTAL